MSEPGRRAPLFLDRTAIRRIAHAIDIGAIGKGIIIIIEEKR